MTPMALNIKKLEGAQAAYDVEDVSEANKLVAGPEKTEAADLNFTRERNRPREMRAAKHLEDKKNQLWFKKLWMISRV